MIGTDWRRRIDEEFLFLSIVPLQKSYLCTSEGFLLTSVVVEEGRDAVDDAVAEAGGSFFSAALTLSISSIRVADM